ncbi:MAG: ABC transporter substrate-binding protein [Burkholderiales bacterium]|nr:ABC transporter substrate-binding protein [Burkholderiales bacterium]
MSVVGTSVVEAQTTIGAAAPLTGQRALLGRNMKQGIELAVEEINAAGGVLGKPFAVVFEDDQGDNPNAGINAVNKLIQVDKVSVMLGPHYTVNQMATQKSFCERGPLSLTGASGVPVTANNCRYVIRVRASDIIQAKALIEFARKELKAEKVGVLYINDDFGKAGADRVVKSMQAMGMKPVAEESHNPGDKDFSAQLARFRNAGAQAVIMWTHDTEAALIVRQARQLGLNFHFAGSTSLSEPSFLKLAGDAAEGVLSANDFVPTNPDPKVQAFAKKYEAKYKMAPEIWAAAYFDATHLAAQAIKQAGTADATKVRTAFDTLRYTGVLGDYRCEANGDCNHQILIVETKGGKPIVRSTVKL